MLQYTKLQGKHEYHFMTGGQQTLEWAPMYAGAADSLEVSCSCAVSILALAGIAELCGCV